MARSDPQKLPKYRLHKRTGLAVVTLSGRDVYLGKHETEERRIAGRPAPSSIPERSFERCDSRACVGRDVK